MGHGPGNSIGDDVQVVLAQTAAPNAYLTDFALVRTGKRKLKMLFDRIDDKNVTVQLEPTLLIDNTGELPRLTELRRTTAQTVKEMLVRQIKTFQHLLCRLAMKQPPRYSLREMRLHLSTRDIFPIQGIVPLLQGKGMVPYETSLAKHRVQLCRSLRTIELVCVCNHNPKHIYSTNIRKILGIMKPKYTHSAHCVYNIGYHLIWCTKYRKKLIYGEIETYLKRLVRAKCRSLGVRIGQMETMPDHMHIFVVARQVSEPSRLVAQLKGYTSRELLRLFPRLRRRWGVPVLWSKSYFCESVGHISQDTVQRYIEMQKQR